ncbi:hypothetical protein V8G54_028116 [Vigna mungo]|uniref:Uncharacterized protein n=1 Tax=Vigna mungo TaxID=3915 RepID=A0AAQ3RLE1_VIGMU
MAFPVNPSVSDGIPSSFVAFSHYRPRQSVMAIPVVLMQVSSLLDGAILSKSSHLKEECGVSMEGRVDGRFNVMEGRLETVEIMEIAVDRMKVQTWAISQDLQEIIRMLGGRGHNQDDQNWDRREEEEGERGDGHHEVQHNGKKRVDLPVFEGFDPMGFWELGGDRGKKKCAKHTVAWREKAKAKNRSWEGLKGRWCGDLENGIGAQPLKGIRLNIVRELQEPLRNQELMAAMPIARDGEELHGGAKTGGGGMGRNLTNWSRLSGAVSWVEPSGSVCKEVIQASGLRRQSLITEGEIMGIYPTQSLRKVGRKGIVSDHQCPERSLRMLIMAEDEKEDGAAAETKLAQMQIEHFAGASHTVVGKGQVEELGLPMEDTPPYQVCLGDEQRNKTNPSRTVSIEAVENHMPQVIVIDEIGTKHEAMAASTIAQRGIQLVATARGITIENVIMNLSLEMLVGGIESMTLGDEEANRRGVQKTDAPTHIISQQLEFIRKYQLEIRRISGELGVHLCILPSHYETNDVKSSETFGFESELNELASNGQVNGSFGTLDRLPLLPEEALLGCVSSAGSSSGFPSYDQSISQCHGLKLHCSNLENKVVLQRGVMIGYRGIGA